MYHFWHFNDHHKTPRVNMIAGQMTPFFSSTLWAVAVGIFHFCISGPSKFNSMLSFWYIIRADDTGDCEPWWPKILSSVTCPPHFEIHFAGPDMSYSQFDNGPNSMDYWYLFKHTTSYKVFWKVCKIISTYLKSSQKPL